MIKKTCAYGSHDCGENNMGPCIHHQRDEFEARLIAMTEERDAACDAANEFLENSRQFRANWTADVQKLIAAQDDLDRLRAFKDYVHKRLDDAGIPTHPNGYHSKAGCRIGDRLDILLLASHTCEAKPPVES